MPSNTAFLECRSGFRHFLFINVFERGDSDMKKITLLSIILLCISLLLTSCSFIGPDVSNLMRPPKLTKEQDQIQKSLEKILGSNVQLKYPSSGDYRSAIIMHDLNGDKVNEAIIFYSPQNESDGTRIHILTMKSGKWETMGDIGGSGYEIDQVAFAKLTSSKVDDFIVGWKINNTDKGVSVYSYKNQKFKEVFTEKYSQMNFLDINNDNKTELVIINHPTDSQKTATVRAFEYLNNSFFQIGQAPMDGSVVEYTNSIVGNIPDGGKGLYVDGQRTDNSLITELIYFKDGKLITPFYDVNKQTVTTTYRPVDIPCSDINNDGIVEIPISVALPGYETKPTDEIMWLTRWCAFDGSNGLNTVLTAVTNSDSSYYFIYPQKWEGKVTIDNNSTDGSWIFKKYEPGNETSSDTIFTIKVFSEKDWSLSSRDPAYSELIRSEGKVYAAKLETKNSDNDSVYMSLDDIKKSLKLIQ